MAYIVLVCQWLLVSVFAIAATSKLRSRSALAGHVAATARLLPDRWSGWQRPAAVAVVVVELTIVLTLLAPLTTGIGFAAAALLSGAFATAIHAALRRGERAPCRCFGMSTVPLGYPHVFRNVLLAAVALVGLRSTTQVPESPVPVAGGAIAVTAALAVSALVVRMDDLVGLFTSARR